MTVTMEHTLRAGKGSTTIRTEHTSIAEALAEVYRHMTDTYLESAATPERFVISEGSKVKVVVNL